MTNLFDPELQKLKDEIVAHVWIAAAVLFIAGFTIGVVL